MIELSLTKEDLNEIDDLLEELIGYYNGEENSPEARDDKVQRVYDILDRLRTVKDTLLK